MTPQEAIRPLKELSARKKMADQCDQASASDIRLYHALDTAIEALEKQIPKKPVSTGLDHELADLYVGFCPRCFEEGVEWIINSAKNFCDKCGQAIDWGE